MRSLFALAILTICLSGNAQHCPWDCSGMIIMETNMPKGSVYKMKPVLVDENKVVITDTIYGTGLPTYDRCDFLYFSDFMTYRKKKIAVHHWYEYDTMYHFAAGKYIVRYNFCAEREKKLYLRYTDPSSKRGTYQYIEIPEENRIHLHEYNNELRSGQAEKLRDETKNFVLTVDCKNWNLQKPDCR